MSDTLTTGDKTEDAYNLWAKDALIKVDNPDPAIQRAIGGNPNNPRVTGFTGGFKAGFENFANIILPNVYGGYAETEGITAGIGAGLGNPVNDLLALAPIGLIPSAILGAVGNTVTDYVSKKNSDENAEYSYQDLVEQSLTGAGLGLALKGIAPLTKGIIGKGIEVVDKVKNKIQGNKLDVDTPLPNVRQSGLDIADTQFITPKAIQDDILARNGVLNLENGDVLNTNNPFKGMSNTEINDTIKPLIPKVANEIPKSDLIDKYISKLDVKELPDKLPAIKDAIGLRSLYGDDPMAVNNALGQVQYRFKNKYIGIAQQALDKETYQVASDLNNKRAIFRAVYGQSVEDNPIVNNIGGLFKNLNKTITDDINIRGNIGYIENRMGVQNWEREILDNPNLSNETMLTDLQNSGGKIIEDNELREFNLEDVKYIRSNLTKDEITGGFVQGGSKQRKIFFDNADGAFNIEAKYGGNRSILEILNNIIFDGSKKASISGVLGENPANTLTHYKNIIPNADQRGWANLERVTIKPVADDSDPFWRDVVAGINVGLAVNRSIKTALNPLWQVAFAPSDVMGAGALAMSRYGGNLFKEMKNTSFNDLKLINKQMSQYADLHNILNEARDVIRDNAYLPDNTGFTGKAERVKHWLLTKDMWGNGSHMADTPVRKTAMLLTGIGEHNKIINGGTIGNIDRELVLESMKGKYLPDGDVLLSKAKELKSSGDLEESIKYAEAGNATHAYFQARINEANPLVYKDRSPVKKSSIAHVLPFSMNRWVLNSYQNINVQLYKAILKNGRGLFSGEANYGALGWSLAGLVSYGAGIGIVETLFDYMRNPKDYKDAGDLAEALAKNTFIGMVAGSIYIPAMGTYQLAKGIKTGITTGDWEKAQKSSTMLQAINWLHKGLQ